MLESTYQSFPLKHKIHCYKNCLKNNTLQDKHIIQYAFATALRVSAHVLNKKKPLINATLFCNILLCGVKNKCPSATVINKLIKILCCTTV